MLGRSRLMIEHEVTGGALTDVQDAPDLGTTPTGSVPLDAHAENGGERGDRSEGNTQSEQAFLHWVLLFLGRRHLPHHWSYRPAAGCLDQCGRHAGVPGLKQASDHDDEVVSHPPRSCRCSSSSSCCWRSPPCPWPVAGCRASPTSSLRAVPVVFVALAVQVVIISLDRRRPGLATPGAAPVHLRGGALVRLDEPRASRRLALGLGGLCNFVAIAANGGTMPASRGSDRGRRRRARFSRSSPTRGVVDHARLGFLGDVFAIPASWPVHNVFSIGDVLIALGAFVLVHSVCGSRLARLHLGSGWRTAHHDLND